ncbi:hypothetical protein BJ508DRAFT_347101 [Ascobolus immersus RN42]|uniref:Uncharacterized protein n=1 Tax=Ascobolus immersus RN42 TaxID=1160509 RepID=A0A3N4I371_ASCIM|nr:hypothetical protein BJ508DRAFT_347101 [Ascobolus immersus RN42]
MLYGHKFCVTVSEERITHLTKNPRAYFIATKTSTLQMAYVYVRTSYSPDPARTSTRVSGSWKNKLEDDCTCTKRMLNLDSDYQPWHSTHTHLVQISGAYHGQPFDYQETRMDTNQVTYIRRKLSSDSENATVQNMQNSSNRNTYRQQLATQGPNGAS